MACCKIPLNVVLALLVLGSSVTVAIVASVPTLVLARDTATAMGAELVEGSVRASLGAIGAAAEGWLASTRMLERLVDRSQGALDEDRLIRTMLELLAELEPSGITYLSACTEQGHFFGLESTGTQWNLRVRNATVPCRTRFVVPNRGDTRNVTLVPTTEVSCSYDPRLRSWYRQLNQSRTIDVTTAYVYSSKPELGLTFGRQLLWPNGTVFGVVTVDVSTASLSTLLDALAFGRSGQALLVEVPSLVVLATSTNELLLSGYNNSAPTQATATTTPVGRLDTGYARAALAEAGALVTSAGNVSAVSSGAETWVAVRDLRLTPRMHWRVVVAVPADDYLGDVKRSRDATTGVVVAVVVAATAVSMVLLLLLLRPIAVLQARVEAVARLEVGEGAGGGGSGGAPAQRSAIAEIAALQKHMDGLQNAVASFARYIPKEVVKDMLFAGEGVAQIGMAPAHVCVLFADIVRFTSLCENTTTAQLSTLLSAFFDRSVSVLLRQGATIDKFIGDAIMAFWGAPVEAERPEVMACLGVLHMQAEVASAVAPLFAAEGHVLDVTYGLNSGQALVGNIGCPERISYTALGDEVNVAARLEGANKAFGTRVLLSEAVRERISGSSFLVAYLGKVRVVGRSAPVRVFTILDVLDAMDNADLLSADVLSSDMFSNSGIASPLAGSFNPGPGNRRGSTTSRLTTNTHRGAYAAKKRRRRRGDFETLGEAMMEVQRLLPRAPKLEAAAAQHLTAAMQHYDKGPDGQALAAARQELRLCEEALRMLEGSRAHHGGGAEAVEGREAVPTPSPTHHDLVNRPVRAVGLSIDYVRAVAGRCASSTAWSECIDLTQK